MSEFTTPEFLQNHSPEELHAMMVGVLPSDIDLSAGGHAWNMTYPSALIAGYLCEYILPEVIKIAFPEWSYGEFLDGHAKGRGITRRAATAATGEITITGQANMVIPAGSLFATAAVNDEPSVDYRTLADAIIPEGGSITVDVECTQTGTVGNCDAGTVVLVGSKLTGITAVVNEKAISGGTEEEDDDTLKERINVYDKSQGESYVGSAADYKRWALSVPGVGDATVISAQDDTGLVTIILTDLNGDPATEQLRESVYNYIMRPDDPGARLAPPNAYLSVVAPSTIAIGIRATIELEPNATIESVTETFRTKLALYLPVALEEKEVKLSEISACLSATDGIADFDLMSLGMGVKTNGGITYNTANIPITTSQLPTVAAEDLKLSVGTV